MKRLVAHPNVKREGLVALDYRPDASRFQVLTTLALRMSWIVLALSWQARY